MAVMVERLAVQSAVNRPGPARTAENHLLRTLGFWDSTDCKEFLRS